MEYKNKFPYIIYLLSLVAYIWIGYFTHRTNFTQFLLFYTITFAGYLIIISRESNIRTAIIFGIVFRASMLFSLPNLSDDYFRFIWDGRLLINGENPFMHVPSYYINTIQDQLVGIDRELFSNLNSPNYFTIYPPINQFVFWMSCFVFPTNIEGNVLIIKCIILIFEIGILFLLNKMLPYFGLPKKGVLIYALNPIIIIELTGNLHFEGIMVFFVLLFLIHFYRSRYTLSAISLGIAAGIKLVPLIFLPLMLRRIGVKKAIYFYLIVGAVFVIPFIGFWFPGLYKGYFSSILLYFEKFEFNASIYYLIRWIGFKLTGYNLIESIGPVLGLVTLILIMMITIAEKKPLVSSLPLKMVWCLFIYYAFASIVHPWYLVLFVALTPFISYRFTIAWSGLIMLSYATYQFDPYNENLWLTTIEYIIVFTVLVYELYIKWAGKIPLSIKKH